MTEPFRLIDGTLVDLDQVASLSPVFREGTAGNPKSGWYFLLVLACGFKIRSFANSDQKALLTEEREQIFKLLSQPRWYSGRSQQVVNRATFEQEYLGRPWRDGQ